MYKIDIRLTIPLREFVDLRKSNLKVTAILWIDTGFDIYKDGETYTKQTPILIWLN